MKGKQNSLLRNIIAASFIVLAVMVNTAHLNADDCQAACNEYVRCAGEIAHRPLTASERTQGLQSCLRSCSRHRPAVTACYRQMSQSGNSCPVYARCIMNAFNIQPNQPGRPAGH